MKIKLHKLTMQIMEISGIIIFIIGCFKENLYFMIGGGIVWVAFSVEVFYYDFINRVEVKIFKEVERRIKEDK